MDEGQVGPETTVRQLVDLVEEGSKNPPRLSFPRWGMRWWCRMTRGALQRGVVFPFVALPYGLKVTGPRAPGRNHRPRALRVEPQPRSG